MTEAIKYGCYDCRYTEMKTAEIVFSQIYGEFPEMLAHKLDTNLTQTSSSAINYSLTYVPGGVPSFGKDLMTATAASNRSLTGLAFCPVAISLFCFHLTGMTTPPLCSACSSLVPRLMRGTHVWFGNESSGAIVFPFPSHTNSSWERD